MILQDIIKNEKKLNVVFKKNNVVLAYIYGSVAKKKEGPLSDIDVAVLFSEKIEEDDYFDLRIKVSREIDKILKTDKTEAVCLNQISPLLKYEVVYGGIAIYSLNAEMKRNFEFTALQQYEDFKYHLNTGLTIMKNQIEHGTFGKPLISLKSKYLERYVSNK